MFKRNLWCLLALSVVPCASAAKLSVLPYTVVDAEYSDGLDRLVLVSAMPNQLHIYDGFGRVETGAVELPTTPTCVSVSPDGLYAAVGHNAWVSYVNLRTARIEKTLPISVDVLDIVLAGNGHAYAFPRRDQWTSIVSLNLQTGQETPGSGMSIYAGTVGRLHPGGKAIYGADNGLSPSDIEKYDISAGTLKYLYDSPYHGDYAMCGNLWISKDGLRIFTRCGNVFRSSEVREQDMRYNGSLQNMQTIAGIAHSPQQNRIAVINSAWESGTTRDTQIHFFGYEYLNYEGAVALPSFDALGTAFAAHARFVFSSADGSTFFVVTQADPSSGMLRDYGVTAVSINDAIVLHGASYRQVSAAPASIQTVFGVALAKRTESAQTLPLPGSLAGISCRLIDAAGATHNAPLFFASPNQINFWVPDGVAVGPARLAVVREDGTEAVADMPIGMSSPGIFCANSDGKGVPAGTATVVRADSSQVLLPLFQFSSGKFVPNHIQARRGEKVYLTLYGTGLRAARTVTAVGNGTVIPVAAMVAHPDFIGLDQVNLGPLPEQFSYTTLTVELTADGQTANPVTVLISNRN
jgi:uncharacterized protein (TIGR03437 family)